MTEGDTIAMVDLREWCEKHALEIWPAVALMAGGYSQAEAAKLTGFTRRQLQERLYKARKKLAHQLKS